MSSVDRYGFIVDTPLVEDCYTEEKGVQPRGYESMSCVFMACDGRKREVKFTKPKDRFLTQSEQYDCRSLAKTYQTFLDTMDRMSSLKGVNAEKHHTVKRLKVELSEFREKYPEISIQGLIVPKIKEDKNMGLPPPNIGKKQSFFSWLISGRKD